MPIGTPTLGGDAGGTTSATTASFTPAANSTLFAIVASKAPTPTRPTISDSLGGTWLKIADFDSTGASPQIVASLYRQAIGASPSAMTVSANGGTTATNVSAFYVTGVGTDFTNYAVGVDTAAGDPSCTLPNALSSGSVVITCALGHLGNVFTAPGGYTKLFDATLGSNFRASDAYNLAPSSTTAAWTSTNTNSVAIALELKLPSTGITGTASGHLGLAGSSVGAVRVAGSASGTFALSGIGTGKIAVHGASSGLLALSGSAAGRVTVKAGASGSLSPSGSAAGTVGSSGILGSASGHLSIGGVSIGSVSVRGSVNDNLAFLGSAAAGVSVRGSGGGTLDLSGASVAAARVALAAPPERTIAGDKAARTTIGARAVRSATAAVDLRRAGASPPGRAIVPNLQRRTASG